MLHLKRRMPEQWLWPIQWWTLFWDSKGCRVVHNANSAQTENC